MKQAQVKDINNRLHCLTKINNAQSQNKNRSFLEGAQFVLKQNRPGDIKRHIEAAAYSNREVPFYAVMELFDALAINGTPSDISKMASIIAENIVPKTRNAKEMQTLMKRKNTSIAHKVYANYDRKDGHTSGGINSSKAVADQKKAEQNTAAIKEGYQTILDEINICIACDRVLENYNRISKRFNLEYLINENTKHNGVKDTIVELCTRIDTYEMPNAVKFNTVIETALYGFSQNNIEFNKSDIIETALNYFAFKPNGLKECGEVMDATIFYDKESDSNDNIKMLMEDQPEDDRNDIQEQISTFYAGTISESVEFSELFNKFKKEEASKDEKTLMTRFKSLISKLYARNVNSVVEDTPDLLQWIRSFFIIGSAAIPIVGPICMIIGFIADRFISIHMNREESEKMAKCFANEIKASKAKLESSNNAEDKERLEKYIKSLEEAHEKITMYYMDLRGDNEEYEIPSAESNKDEFDFDDDFFDDEFEDDDLLESVFFKKSAKLTEAVGEFVLDNPLSDSSIYNLASEADDEDLINLCSLATMYPDEFHKDSICQAIRDKLVDIRSDKIVFESTISRVTKIAALYDALNILESNSISTNDPHSLKDMMMKVYYFGEAYQAVVRMSNAIAEKNNSILEASFGNSIKLASLKLKQAMTKLKDKDKQISQNIDISMNNFKKSAERALTNDNREAIIKGSVLPSASKIVKIALATGITALINPVIAVIGLLGYLGCSAKFKAKERQMVIDELEIELKMCQKYIDIAEQKNDMKALKQLLQTQRELERQKQRIKYKMQVDFGQKYYDAKSDDD